jgi:hypothetical protein
MMSRAATMAATMRAIVVPDSPELECFGAMVVVVVELLEVVVGAVVVVVRAVEVVVGRVVVVVEDVVVLGATVVEVVVVTCRTGDTATRETTMPKLSNALFIKHIFAVGRA